jgi:serine/threonine-protein kinase
MRSSKNVDHRTDIWALGVILYQLSTGRVPFPGETITEVCSGVLADEPASLTVIAHIPAAFDGIVRRCLQKNPTARFANARELASALAGVAGASPGTSGLNLQVAAALPGHGQIDPARPGTVAMDGPPPQLAQALSRSQGGQVAQSGQTQTEWGRPVAPPQKKSSAGLLIGLLGLALVGGGIGAFVFMQKGKATEPAATAKETASEPATAKPVETATAQPAFGDGPHASATPTSSATLAASAPVSAEPTAEPTAKPTATAVAAATTKVVVKTTPTAKPTAVVTSKPVATARPTVGGGIF